MKPKTVFVILSWLSVLTLLPGQVWAQGAAAPLPPCAQPVQPPAQPGGALAPQRLPRAATVTMISGVVAAGAKWTKVWQAGGNSADGIVADKDGSTLVAQEDYDAVLRIDKNDKASVYLSNTKGIGSLSFDRQGRLYGVHRTERPGSTKPDIASIVNAITLLAPERKMVADKWADGTTLTVRPNDLTADSQGGAYFTSGCLYYASPNRTVAVVARDLRTNGIVFSTDDKILYVTNGGTIVAFD